MRMFVRSCVSRVGITDNVNSAGRREWRGASTNDTTDMEIFPYVIQSMTPVTGYLGESFYEARNITTNVIRNRHFR